MYNINISPASTCPIRCSVKYPKVQKIFVFTHFFWFWVASDVEIYVQWGSVCLELSQDQCQLWLCNSLYASWLQHSVQSGLGRKTGTPPSCEAVIQKRCAWLIPCKLHKKKMQNYLKCSCLGVFSCLKKFILFCFFRFCKKESSISIHLLKPIHLKNCWRHFQPTPFA